MNDFSIKDYLSQIQHTLETVSRDMAATKAEVKELHRSMDNQISQTKAEMRREITEQKVEFTKFQGEIKKDVEILAVRLGFIFAGASVLISAIISLAVVFIVRVLDK